MNLAESGPCYNLVVLCVVCGAHVGSLCISPFSFPAPAVSWCQPGAKHCSGSAAAAPSRASTCAAVPDAWQSSGTAAQSISTAAHSIGTLGSASASQAEHQHRCAEHQHRCAVQVAAPQRCDGHPWVIPTGTGISPRTGTATEPNLSS